MSEEKFSPGDIIYREGDVSDCLLVVRSGQIEVSRDAPSGRIRLGTLGKGDIFGETGLIQGNRRSTTMTAIDDVSLLRVPKEVFAAAYGKNNPIGLPLLKMLCSRLEKVDEALASKHRGLPEGVQPADGEHRKIVLLGADPAVDREIGPTGIEITQLPYKVGRCLDRKSRTIAGPGSLTMHVGDDFSLGQEHFAIEKRSGSLYLRDLGSQTGTLVNDDFLSRFGDQATAKLLFGHNRIIAGAATSPFRFHLLIDKKEDR